MNGQPPWYAYRAFIIGQLNALEKQPGVRPVGVGETWRCIMAKFILKVMGQEAKAACRTDQLAGGVELGIRGGGYMVCAYYGQRTTMRMTGVF